MIIWKTLDNRILWNFVKDTKFYSNLFPNVKFVELFFHFFS